MVQGRKRMENRKNDVLIKIHIFGYIQGVTKKNILDCPIQEILKIGYSILIGSYLGSLISYRNFFVLFTELWIPSLNEISPSFNQQTRCRTIHKKK